MRTTIRMLSIVALFSLALFSIGVGQMKGDKEHSSDMKSDSTSKPEMMTMMHNMSDHCKMMKNDFDKLDDHLNKMMQMNDLNALKAEMKKHHEMMRSMHEQMNKQQGMCQNMMSMMHSGDSNGMMEMKGSDSAKTADHSHPH